METGYYANDEAAYFVTPGGRVYLLVSAEGDGIEPPVEVELLPKDAEWIQDGESRPELVERAAMIAD